MKALFAHDHRFIPADGQVWSESQFEAALWERYLAHFESLTVAARFGGIPYGKAVADLELSSAPDVRFELFPNLSSIRGLTLARPAARQRMRALVEEHDCVIARPPGELAFVAIACAQSLGKPWAVQVDGCPWDGFWNYGTVAGKLYAPMAWYRMRRAVGRSDHAIYVTQEFLQKRYPTRAQNTASVSNVRLGKVEPDNLCRRLARIDSLGTSPIRLGLIGSLKGRVKGIQTVFAAIAKLGGAANVEFRILGPGNPAPWKHEAKRFCIEKFVFFEGTLPAGEKVLSWLNSIDIYLQPSLKEGLPRALVEAMSRGCPAIASRAAGIPELLSDDDLITPGDSSELARLLARRLTDRDWMRSRARMNWERSKQYQSDVLDARREEFWKRFVHAASGQATA